MTRLPLLSSTIFSFALLYPMLTPVLFEKKKNDYILFAFYCIIKRLLRRVTWYSRELIINQYCLKAHVLYPRHFLDEENKWSRERGSVACGDNVILAPNANVYIIAASSEMKNISAIFKHVLFNVYSLLASDFFWNQRGDGDYDKCKLPVCCFQSVLTLPTYEWNPLICYVGVI